MSKYELTFLVPTEAGSEEIKKLITSLKGTVTGEEKWGKRELSYPMKKQMEAFYFTWKLDLEDGTLPEMKKKLSFNENLLRYLLLKVE